MHMPLQHAQYRAACTASRLRAVATYDITDHRRGGRCAAPDRVVAVTLRHELEAARAAGVPFADAWTAAVEHAVQHAQYWERARWRSALTDTADAWAAGYEGAGGDVDCFALLGSTR